MQYRLNTTALTLTGVVVVLAIGLFAYTYVKAPSTDDEPSPKAVEQATRSEQEKTISAKHKFDGGLHTLAGAVDMPTSCDKVVAEPFFIGPARGEVEVRFTTTTEGENCTNESTSAPFYITFEGPENLAMTATWNGTPATLNLVPAAVGEDLHNYGGDIKG